MQYDLTAHKRPIKRPEPRKDVYLDPRGRLRLFATADKKPNVMLATRAAISHSYNQLVGEEVGLNKEIEKLNNASERYINPIQKLIYDRNMRIKEYRDILASNYRAHLTRHLSTGITHEEATHKANISIKKDVEHYAKQIEDEFPKKKLEEFAEKKALFNELIGWGKYATGPKLVYDSFI